ncbi:copper chaperone CopZ [Enterococcus saccharolyticus]|uniref:Copper chaperone CopZ n=1 Tax=Candidatus Enterococcus willemsii TaxID=1857215 RepID=A0ABQ6YZ80_9ENTE|nr:MULTISPECIES: copper chaperone CopZ [Enterococcus]KAF1303340.1 copper-binding protein [Enterococcus sp. CU12B]MCD5001765.1 copper chaperone CopZ [Enterococcus saccharolyticus]
MKQTFAINGMSCQHCVGRVEKAVHELPGIKKVKVNLKKQNGVIKFDETETSAESIVAAINETGYEAKVL